MSDGPYRSLPLSKVWKDFAEAVHLEAYTDEVRSEALLKGVQADALDTIGKPGLIRVVEAFLGKSPDLFSPSISENLDRLMEDCGPSAFLSAIVDHGRLAIMDGLDGEAALRDATSNAISSLCRERSRQVEEHYFRKASEGETTVQKAQEMGEGCRAIASPAFLKVATERLIALGKGERVERLGGKKAAIDDGPALAGVR